jgi:MFS family permease
MASKVDLVERVSYLSSNTKGKDGYEDASTPVGLEDGALRAGGAPHLLSKESFGLLAQYAAVGLVYGTLPNLVYSFLQSYLSVEGQVSTSANALLSIPWSLKVFIGMLTDNVPIFGYRRRPFMMFGWAMCSACLFIMGIMNVPKPFWDDPAFAAKARDIPSSEWAANGLTFNKAARDAGAKYVVLMMLASLGYVIADVAADAVLVEYAQREPEAVRGRTQTAIYTTRTFFQIFAQAIIAFFLNGPEYGGDFSWSIGIRAVFLILACFCVPIVFLTWFFVKEEKYAKPHFGTYIGNLWEAIQSRAFYQVIAYSFFANVFAGVSYVASNPVMNIWIKATNLNYNLSSIFGNVVMVVTLIVTGKYGLHWNWRWVIAITMFAVIGIDVIVVMLGVWDVVRSQWFWLGVPIVEQVPASISFIVSTYVVVELAGEGNEGACYGMMTTIMNLGSPFALTITKNINAGFDVWNDDIIADTHHVRTQVTYTIMIQYAAKLFSLVFLVLLPSQKAATQELMRKGGSSKIMGAITIFYCMFALVWSIMTNLFSIFESTKCLKITGGCHD